MNNFSVNSKLYNEIDVFLLNIEILLSLINYYLENEINFRVIFKTKMFISFEKII